MSTAAVTMLVRHRLAAVDVGQDAEAQPAQRLRQAGDRKGLPRQLEMVALVEEAVRDAAGRRAEPDADEPLEQRASIEARRGRLATSRTGSHAPILVSSEGLRPSDSPTRALARRSAGSLRSRGSLAALARDRGYSTKANGSLRRTRVARDDFRRDRRDCATPWPPAR